MITKIFNFFKTPQHIKGIRGYFWCKLVPTSFMCLIRDRVFRNVGRPGRIIRKILFPPQMRPYYDFFNFYMNDKMAEWIRFHCVVRPHTWRALSREFKIEYPESDIESECQYDGEWLQRYCEDYLRIDISEMQENSKEFHESIEDMAKVMSASFARLNLIRERSGKEKIKPIKVKVNIEED